MRFLKELLRRYKDSPGLLRMGEQERTQLLREMLELKGEQGFLDPPAELFRYRQSGTAGARSLAEGGFRPELLKEQAPHVSSTGEPNGLYWAKHPDDLGPLIAGGPTDYRQDPNIWGKPLPGTKMFEFTPDEAEVLEQIPGPEITRAFRGSGANFLDWPDTIVSRPWQRQIVQIEPNSVEAKIQMPGLDKTYVTRILGLAGALGLGGAAMPQEGEASPLKRIIQDASKLNLGGVSSAAKQLIGRSFPQFEGRVVKDVRQGRGDTRYILFKDGMVAEVTKGDLHDLSRTTGTQDYMQKFQSKDEAGKQAQALKSLQRHERMHSSLVRKSTVTSKASEHLKASGQISGLQEDLVGVMKDGKYMTMPRPYAEYLQKAGILKITKEIPK